MKKVRKYLGIRPEKDFTLLSSFNDKATKSDWRIYEDLSSSDKWWLFKVISDKPVLRKANYSLAYDPKTKRLTGKDLVIMAKHSPNLLQAFLQKADFEIQYFGVSYAETIEEMLKNELN
jgi:hypothetical protein